MKECLAIAQAMADETRLRILRLLDGSTLCLSDFTEILGLAPSTLSKHLRILVEAGLITARQAGRWRYYRWSEEKDKSSVRLALDWVRRCLDEDPLAVDDAARRALALQRRPVPASKKDKQRVLFLCTGNSCRSQMAEGLLRKHAGTRFEIFSAGLEPREIPAMTYEVMEEAGVDIRGERPKNVLEFLGKEHFHFLITVCANAESRAPLFPGVSRRLHWPVDDPAEETGNRRQRMATFRRVRDELEGKILDWLDEAKAVNQ